MMFRIEPFPGKVRKVKNKYVMTDEQEAWMKEWYPRLKNEKIMRMTGLTFSTMHRFARLYGLTKTEQTLKRIWRASGRKVKRTCEKNGYYASLRGKRPSEACLAAFQEYLHSDRYVNPLRRMREQSPKKYRESMKKRSESRRALIKKEKARILYGLPQKTRLKNPVTLVPYTRRQVGHRHAALKRGYILMVECHEGSGERWNIYYDADTKRGEKFERNCMEDGFRFLEYTEQ